MSHQTLHNYVHEAHLNDASRPALYVAGRAWSYEELRNGQRAIGEFLTARGIAGQQTVGVLANKSMLVYQSLLGIMERGNIYVPMAPKFPAARLAQIADQAELKAIIVENASVEKAAELLQQCRSELLVLLPQAKELPESLIPLQRHNFVVGEADAAALRPGGVLFNTRGEHYAYLLFTSGSTGLPKGVPVTHANACACIEAVQKRFPLVASDRVAHFAELTFDISIGEMFLTWKAGACLYAPQMSELMVPSEFVRRHELTVWSSVPTLANNMRAVGALKPGSLPSVRLSLFCGEPLSRELADAWTKAATASTTVNLYGPTEASIFATSYVYDGSSTTNIVPLGVGLDQMQCRVVDETNHDVAADAVGELLLAGPQVVSGYWENPEATARAFQTLSGDRGGRVWYHTGDLVSVSKEWGLLFHGRKDRQIKMRGYRIELMEIESVLKHVTGAEAAAAVPIHQGDGRYEQIIAYCNRINLDEASIKVQCGAHLPDYMVPLRIVGLAALPTNDNGKIDYRALASRAEQDLAAGKALRGRPSPK
jgi:amino acid adenylation domain-containing protein